MSETILNSFGTKLTFDTGFGKATYYRLSKLHDDGIADVDRLPFSIKVLLEAVLRNENGREITTDHVNFIATYEPSNPARDEIPFNPARVLLQDFTGVPAVVDLAAMRNAMASIGGDPERINPLIPVDLVIDHSVQVDMFNSPEALEWNSKLEFERNRERYEFLHWGQKAFRDFRVVPPASGICHQVNLEYLGKVVQRHSDAGEQVVYPDSLVGTDSHTTMINGLGILGWGVGGIEAEAVMLGQPIYMIMPEVVGVKLTNRLLSGATATDLVLTITQMLRKEGVVGKFVEYFGDGIRNMTVSDRATLSNMAPEYGATTGIFPVDEKTLDYLRFTGRSGEQIELVERYCKEQGLFYTDDSPDPQFRKVVELDLETVEPSLAGPKRPQDRLTIGEMKMSWRSSLTGPFEKQGFGVDESKINASAPVEYPVGNEFDLQQGDVLIAAITSCTNTSNPSVLLGAGILAKKAVEAGLSVAPHIKTSLAPGSKSVTYYLAEAGLAPYLEKLGFYLVGYGCTTCIGNSGPLPEPLAKAVDDHKLVVASVLSGNRNFTGRINPHTKASFLASPPLVVAFAIAGTVNIDLDKEPLGKGRDGRDVYLKDIWPSAEEIAECLPIAQNPESFRKSYDNIEHSNEMWNRIEGKSGALYDWDEKSTYIQEPPFFDDLSSYPEPVRPILNARVLVKAGESVTTDHISPAGAMAPDSEAVKYLMERGVEPKDFNTYGSRRGNDRVMTRGTFGNIMFRNELAGGREGGWTTYLPTGELASTYDAAMRYQRDNTPLVVIAGKDYGMGSSRDWAAKGTSLLGIRVVLAESFERIHRSNLIGMGVLPLQFMEGENASSLNITGREVFAFHIDDNIQSGQEVQVEIRGKDGAVRSITARCRLDSPVEVEYYRNGGILHTVLRRMKAE